MANKNKENNKNKKIISAILTVVIVLISFTGGFFLGGLNGVKSNGLLNEVIGIINNTSYVIDPVTGQPRKITEQDYVNAITAELMDEYSKYYSPEEYAKHVNESGGNYGGLGIVTYSNSLEIFKVIGNSPAQKAGVKAGDVIIGAKATGGQRVDFNSVEELNEYFKQHSNQTQFTIYFEDGREVSLTSTDFEVGYVTYYDNTHVVRYRDDKNGDLTPFVEQSNEMSGLDDQTGYIKLDLFEGKAASQFGFMLGVMLESGKTKLILDLRDNGGGAVDVLTDVASYLIYNGGAKKSLILHAERKSGKDDYYTKSNNFDLRLQKIVVLANRNTASASECLIGAMLTYGDRFSSDGSDLIIEKNANDVAKTFGKGIMQTTYVLANGGAYKLTTGRVLWPDKKTCIHGTGIIASGENAVSKADALNRAIQVIAG